MRILVTNDDGYQAEGIKLLHDIAKQLTDDVWLCAPNTNNSATSRALLSHEVNQLTKIDDFSCHISAPPAFCVSYALEKFISGRRPNLILSGINKGSNIGIDIGYSGTVGAAMEGTAHGIFSIALSQALPDDKGYENREEYSWDNVKRYALPLIKFLCKTKFTRNTMPCIDFPACHPDEVKGVLLTHQFMSKVRNRSFLRRADEYGRRVILLGPRKREYDEDAQLASYPGSDLSATRENYISIVPIKLELTDYDQFGYLNKQLRRLNKEMGWVGHYQ